MERKSLFNKNLKIGQGGIEPPTSWSRTKRATPALLPVATLLRQIGLKKPAWWRVTGATGIEPAISGLTGRRDNQLRYAPTSLLTGMDYSDLANLCQVGRFFLGLAWLPPGRLSGSLDRPAGRPARALPRLAGGLAVLAGSGLSGPGVPRLALRRVS